MLTGLILYFLVFYLIFSLFFKPNFKVLNCGLFGYVGTVPADVDKIKILGILNEERGKHSAGIYIGEEIIKDTGTFTSLIKSNNLYKELFNLNTGKPHKGINCTIIGHTRQPSTGNFGGKELAHPFGIFKNDNDVEPFMVGAHNGTIYNWKNLCEKFGFDQSKYKIDSQAILALMANNKFDALNHYNGAAALLWTFPNQPNTMFVFKGASKSYANSPSHIEDRPLFYWKTKNQGVDCVYISSIKDSLKCIGGEDENIRSFENNVIYFITPEGILTKLKVEITRKDAYSYDYSKPTTSTNTYSSNNYTNHNTIKSLGPVNNIVIDKNNIDYSTVPAYLFDQIPFYKKFSNHYSGGLKKIYQPTLIDVFENTVNQLGGRVYYGKDCKMYRNGHKLGQLIHTDITKLKALKEKKKLKEFEDYLFKIVAQKYTLDRLGFSRDSLYSLYTDLSSYTKYIFIDGYMLQADDNDENIQEFIKILYDNIYDYENIPIDKIASVIEQPIIITNEGDKYATLIVYFNYNNIFNLNGDIKDTIFNVEIPFVNSKVYFDLKWNKLIDINGCETCRINIDYTYNSIVIDNKKDSSFVGEYVYIKKDYKFGLVDHVTLKNGQKELELKTEAIKSDLPFDKDEDVSDKGSDDIDDEPYYMNVDDDMEDMAESFIMRTNFKKDYELMETYYDSANDMYESLNEFLKGLKEETNINTAEATKAFNNFQTDMEQIVNEFESSKLEFSASLNKIEEQLTV